MGVAICSKCGLNVEVIISGKNDYKSKPIYGTENSACTSPSNRRREECEHCADAALQEATRQWKDLGI